MAKDKVLQDDHNIGTVAIPRLIFFEKKAELIKTIHLNKTIDHISYTKDVCIEESLFSFLFPQLKCLIDRTMNE